MNRVALPAAVIMTLFVSRAACALDWPQWMGPDRDGVWRETGLIDKFPKEGPKIRWRVPIGNGYGGPAVVGDRVYVMDRQKKLVDPADKTTGKAADKTTGKPAATRGKSIPGNERLLCLNANDGSIVWKHEYDCAYTISYSNGPRCTPLIRDGRVYALGAMGDLTVLDAATGHVLWTKNLAHEMHAKIPVWGFAAHPLLDGDLLYSLVGGPGSAVVALNKNTGAVVWKALDTQETGYSPPMIYEFGGKKQLIVWLSEALYGLDAVTGKQLWKHAYPIGEQLIRPAVNIITTKKVDDLLFISTVYHGPMMLKITADKATMVWKGQSKNPGKPDGAYCLMASPVFKDGYGYGVGMMGDLHCFDAKTGKDIWQTFAAVTGRKADCGTVFVIPHEDRYVLFNDQGDLILADLTPKGYHEISRAHVLEPVAFARGRNVVWSHPAFADRCVFARNDKEMVCVSLAKPGTNDG
ncbi:MAG TPA: PQQ-binding-like beta-propeller repeat protein [Planctomycetaceae bacterium]|nr:PQQ-binding-like beta-propeller repeat protein [Planctomycetaceae bacterium]